MDSNKQKPHGQIRVHKNVSKTKMGSEEEKGGNHDRLLHGRMPAHHCDLENRALQPQQEC